MQKKWEDGRATSELAETFIAPNDRLTSFDRIEIYNKQYWFRLIDVLYDDYPGVYAVIGRTKFNLLIKEYLTAHPSRSFTLRNLGRHLAEFIDGRRDICGKNWKPAYDMARFEWAQILAFDDPALPPLGIDDFLGANPNKLRLGLQPYISLLELDYPLDDFSIALKKKMRAMRTAASNAAEAPPDETMLPPRMRLPRAKKIWLTVHRHDNDIYFKRLDPIAYRLLLALRDGATLAAACEAAVNGQSPPNDFGNQIRQWFENWTALGWFCAPPTKRKRKQRRLIGERT